MVKSTVNTCLERGTTVKYPYIGKSKSNGLLVLFTAFDTGVTVSATEYTKIGEIKNGWTEENFESFGGQIILENV